MTCPEILDCLPKPPPGKGGFLTFDGEHWVCIPATGPHQVPVFDPTTGIPIVINQDALACSVGVGAPDVGGLLMRELIAEVKLLRMAIEKSGVKPKKPRKTK